MGALMALRCMERYQDGVLVSDTGISGETEKYVLEHTEELESTRDSQGTPVEGAKARLAGLQLPLRRSQAVTGRKPVREASWFSERG